MAVIHTESCRVMCFASGPSPLVPWSEIAFYQNTQCMCCVHSDQQLPPIALSNVPNLAVPKYIVACLSRPRFQYLAHCMLDLTNGMFTASFTFHIHSHTSFPTIVLTLSARSFLYFITSNSCCCHVRDIFYPFCPIINLSNAANIC